MGIKSLLSSYLSPKQMTMIKKPFMYTRYVESRIKKKYGLIEVNKDAVEDIKIYSIAGKHLFFGYYDLQQYDTKKERLLVHALDSEKCDPMRNPIDLMYINCKDGKMIPITSTKAWSWQQGARLRWHPLRSDCVLFNAVEENHYATIVWNIVEGIKIASYPIAFYDVTPDMRYGLGLNYDRLQRLRPGYGYSCFQDGTAGDSVPENEGIIRYDTTTGESKLLISLKELTKDLKVDDNVEHYINHISVAPSGKKFLFFHLWSSVHTTKWGMKLYVADIETGKKICIEDRFVVSHYSWKNDNEIIVTTGPINGNPPQYIKYDINNHSNEILEGEWLKRDGHPSCISGTDCFVSDTYPLKCLQYVFMEKGKVGQEILRVYSDPRLYEEMRCDLHPRLTSDNTHITIDSTYKNRLRQVIAIKMKSNWLDQ